ncbi:MAG: SOS response-associated peptidase [Phycisphaeraceae bacterium]|nr:SOS response-associated peptidase [Phycisphaeraceae bacterium]
MCGRYTHLVTWSQVHQLLRLSSDPIDLPLRYNIAPTQMAPVVRQRGGARSLEMLRWGLVPPWAKDIAIGSGMINARGETLATKPAFRAAFKRRRCLVPASGFYEWDKVSSGTKKQPSYITASDDGPLVFGGLWESWTSPEGQTIETYTIVTTAPNEMMARFHDRMPLVLDASDHDAWLDPEREDAFDLVRAYPAELMLARPVSTRVNSPRNDDASLIEPVEPPRAEGLFG